MAHLSLKSKFGLVLVGAAFAVGLILYTNFETSENVASQLERVKEESVPKVRGSERPGAEIRGHGETHGGRRRRR